MHEAIVFQSKYGLFPLNWHSEILNNSYVANILILHLIILSVLTM